MVNLSVSVDMIPKKEKFTVANGNVYASVTFTNDDSTRDFISKIFKGFEHQPKIAIIEDASIESYVHYFHEAHLLKLRHGILAFDASCNDIINVISNWCFYEK